MVSFGGIWNKEVIATRWKKETEETITLDTMLSIRPSRPLFDTYNLLPRDHLHLPPSGGRTQTEQYNGIA